MHLQHHTIEQSTYSQLPWRRQEARRNAAITVNNSTTVAEEVPNGTMSDVETLSSLHETGEEVSVSNAPQTEASLDSIIDNNENDYVDNMEPEETGYLDRRIDSLSEELNNLIKESQQKRDMWDKRKSLSPGELALVEESGVS